VNVDMADTGRAYPIDLSRALEARLAEALRTEIRVLGTLAEVLDAQRDAVAKDDLQGVEGSVHAVERVLMTLREARRNRGGLLEQIGLAARGPLSALREAFGPRISLELHRAIDDLVALARDIDQRLQTNARLLQRAMERGDRMVREVYMPRTPDTVYPTAGPLDGPGEALLVDRRI
jgi:hypothetical protein